MKAAFRILQPTIFFAFLSVNVSFSFGQGDPYADRQPRYRSEANPYYWKNRPPVPGYWQQDAHYRIRATLDDSLDVITGESYELTYYNNSPGKLDAIFFHLYAEAFQPGSYYHQLWKDNNKPVEFGQKYEAKKLGIKCRDVRVNGQPADTTLDNTLMRVALDEPLLPGDSLTVTMRFTFYFDQGDMRRRAKMFRQWGQKHFNAVHWYPIACVYDRKFGWNVEQHLDKEFYADFGEFEIDLTLPNDYIVEATGVLRNRTEVLPDTLRQKLDLRNFKDKPVGEPPSTPVERVPGLTKTWKFRAVNVHNFAFVASPSYRIGETVYDGIRVATYVREPHAAKWQETPAALAYIIRIYDLSFGEYAYPKVCVADAEDGMEYPMLALCRGFYPGHLALISHEVGHMWFYGMVGNNERYRPALDEGFTQFIETHALDVLYGERLAPKVGKPYVDKRLDAYRNRYSYLYYPYLKTVQDGFDHPLNTRAADFRGAIRQGGAYGLVYYKTGVMLHNLRYVLGDELFYRAIRRYFKQWRMAHPYFEDFRQAVIDEAGTDLNWFFDQWLETTKTIDYAVKRVEKLDAGRYAVHLKRKGEMEMPIDFTVRLKDSTERRFHIPNNWFVKPTDATVLPKWYGWGKLNREYTAVIEVEGEIENVEIDPTLTLADIDRTDNRWRGNRRFEFDHRVRNSPSWERYKNFIRPDIGYSAFDGFQVGLHTEGNYMESDQIYDASLLFSTRLAQDVPEDVQDEAQWVAGHFNFRKRIFERQARQTFLDGGAQYYGAVGIARLGIEKSFKRQGAENPNYTVARLQAKYMQGFSEQIRYYSPLRTPESLDPLGYWPENRLHAVLDASLTRHCARGGWSGQTTLTARSPAVGSDFDLSFLQLEAVRKKAIGKFDLQARLFGRMSFFAGEELPNASALHLAGANPEALQDVKYARLAGIVPTAWTTFADERAGDSDRLQGLSHFQQGGGLNLRGYAGYLNPVSGGEGGYVYQPFGEQGAALNVELGFERLFGIRKLTSFLDLNAYLFADGGVLGSGPLGEADTNGFQADAGLGTVVTVKPGGKYLDVQPLRIRFDMPFYLSDERADGDTFAFRWVMGFGRAF